MKRNNNGFTLMELLAVIVILAVITLIAVPQALKILNNARININKNSVYGIIKAAEFYASEQMINETLETDKNILPELSYKGRTPNDYSYYGYGVYINMKNEIGVAVIYDNNCYLKNFGEDEIKVENYAEINCNLANLEAWNGESEEVIPIDDIYYIYNAKQLAWISEQSEFGNSFEGKTIILKNDINLGGLFDADGNTLDGSKSFTPIGNSNKFSGVFDGENHKIYNLYVNKTDNFSGLFSRTQDAIIKNLVVQNSYIEGENVVGIVAGVWSNYLAEINNVKSINNIIESKGRTVGGIAGQLVTNADTEGVINIINNYSNSNIKDNGNYAGGILGASFNKGQTINISNNQNFGKVMGESYAVGGIVGHLYNNGQTVNINNNQNLGKVMGESYGVGGIVGQLSNNGQIIMIFNNMNNENIQGEVKWIGGIIGITSNHGVNFIDIFDNVNKGNVSTSKGAFRVGGIVGNANSGDIIYNNINFGNIDGFGNGESISYGAGGIVGTCGDDNDEGVQINISKLISNSNYGDVKSNYSAGGIAGNLYDSTLSDDSILYSYNEGTIEAVSGYAGGIIGKMDDANSSLNTLYVASYVNNAYNIGEVKGLNAAGLSGANIGVKNSITFGTLSGTNNYGVIGHTLDGVIIENVYYPNIYTSTFGTDFDINNFTKDDIKNILGSVFWNYDEDRPNLYKVNVVINNQDDIIVTSTNNLLK